MTASSRLCLSGALLALLPVLLHAVPDPNAAWQRTVQGSSLKITGYTGAGGAVTVPDYFSTWDGPPGIIGKAVFSNRADITSVTLPSRIATIEDSAFYGCTSLTAVNFRGHAPSLGSSVFTGDDNATVYYFDGSSGWSNMFGGLPTATKSIYTCTTNDGSIVINGYIGPAIEYSSTWGWHVIIPDTINGLPVTVVGNSAFYKCASLHDVSIPGSVTNIEGSAFYGCSHVWAFYCHGDAPAVGVSALYSNSSTTVYYLPGTTNWSSSFGGLPTVLWNPQVLSDTGFGIQANCFGFTFTNAGNPLVVIEACTNLASAIWSPMATNTLVGGSSSFGDVGWTNHPASFYRFQMP